MGEACRIIVKIRGRELSLKLSSRRMDLVITIDYELYGDGSGDVFETMINPTAAFLESCKKHQIRSTVFFEVIEYLKIKEEWEKGNAMGYKNNPAEAIKDQIIQAFREGHDIQLHIHPQWINATYDKQGWRVDNRYWRLPQVPLEPDDDFPLGLEELIKLGKKTIESILAPTNSSYRCNIFRAGGFNIYPSDQIIPILRRNGFIADSSVFPGAYEQGALSSFDYRNIPNHIPFWWIDNSVTEIADGSQDFVEVPVFAKKMIRMKKYDQNRIKIALRNKKSNLHKIKGKVAKENQSIFQKIGYFFEKEAVTWDYCLFSAGKMNHYLKLAERIEAHSDLPFHPFVLVGHSKEFLLPATFDSFIKKHASKLNFLTLQDAVKKIYHAKNRRITISNDIS